MILYKKYEGCKNVYYKCNNIMNLQTDHMLHLT